MKATLLDTATNALSDRKSETIKSELARYQLLKAKGGIRLNEDTKENKPLQKNDIPAVLFSPSQYETSQSSSQAMIQSSISPSGTNSNLAKSDYWGTSSKNTNTLPNQSFCSGPSMDSYRGPLSQRDKTKFENYPTYCSSPLLKDAKSPTGLRSSKNNGGALRSPASSKEAPREKFFGKKTLASQERSKEKPWSQIEEFVDCELGKEFVNKVFSKTAQHNIRTRQSSGSFSGTQSQTTMIKKAPSSNDLRASSALDLNGKNAREGKNCTPTKDKKDEKLGSGSPKVNIGGISKKGILTPTQDMKNIPLKENKERRLDTEKGLTPRELPQKSSEGDENSLREEIEKWRIFGKMMAESYDELNKRYATYMAEKEKDKKIISALKDQVNTLKVLLKASKDENVKIRDTVSKSANESLSRIDDREMKDREVAQLRQEIEEIRSEHREALKMVEFLKIENETLRKSLDEEQKAKALADHYQKLADARFKECSALAEEIICLRTDLDRSHSNYLRIQREQTSGRKNDGDSFYSAKKIRQVGDQGSLLAGMNSGTKYKKRSDKMITPDDESDDQPPSPADLNMLPSKEESVFIRG